MKAKSRFWRILRMVARASFRARTTPEMSPLSSVMPALSSATSAPVPMAMPTSAAASAGASFTPSPAMATLAPLPRSSSTSACLAPGVMSARISSMPRLLRDRLRRHGVVAGRHDDLQPAFPQRADRIGCVGLDRVGHRDDAGRPAVDGDEHRGASVRPQLVGAAGESGDVGADAAHHGVIAERDGVSVDRAG